jgi:Ca-activated chloride channel family protein
MIAATVCICVALARPQGGYTIETAHRMGLDILVAIDTSKSMLTPDVKPNRLTRAKMAAEDLLGHLNGDSVGLIAFAGDAFLQTPITTDYDAFRDSVEALDTDTIPRGGTDIASPIRLAQATFKDRPGSDRILILLTDGEDLDARGIAAARAAAQQGVRIFTIGVGTTGGDLIPVPDGNGGAQYLKDSSGQLVRSHLDVATLQQIAQAAGGLYEPLGNEGQGLELVYSHGLSSFKRHDLAAQRLRVYTEWFQWPLLAGIVLLMAEALLLTRRRRVDQPVVRQGQARHPLANRMAKAAPAALAVLGLSIATPPGIAHASAADAEKAYDRGDYTQASKEYEASARKRPAVAKLQFDVGSAAYKAGDLKTATAAFQTAVKTGDPVVQESAYYNLGNTEYRTGEHAQQAQPQTTIERWQAALKSYETALQLRPADTDAKFNHDLVQHRLAPLQQQQQSQNKADQKQQPSGGGQKQNSQSGGQGQPKGSNQTARNGNAAQQPAGHDTSTPGAAEPQQTAGSPSQPTPGSSSPNASRGTGTPVAAAGTNPTQPANQSSTGGAQPAGPGQLTREEAEHLLDSLKGDQRRLTASSGGPNSAPDDSTPPLKDW